MKNAPLFLALLLIAQWSNGLFAQSTSTVKVDQATASLLQREMQRGSRSQSAMLDRLITGRESALGLTDDTIPGESLADSTSDLADSESLDTSVYESLVRGYPVDPDEILNRINIFGHDVFKNGNRQSSYQQDQVAVPADYPVGSGDEIIVSLWGRINEEHSLTVDRDGKLNIPRVGPIAVAGQRFKTVRKTIVERVQAIEGVQASAAMGQLRAIRIFVVGEVNNPGQYTMSPLSNPTHALFAAGGTTKEGSLRNIEVRRNGRRIAQLDFYDFLLKGNNFNRIALKPGDVLFVPVVKKMVAVAGNVRRSALYELKGNSTLANVIDLAGGFTPAAWINKVQVDRFGDNNYQEVLEVEIDSPKDIPPFPIHDGDIVRVFQIVNRDKNAIYLTGNVHRPRKFEYTDGARVSDIISSYNDLLPETYLDYAVIYRREAPTMQERIISFSLKSVLDNPNSEDNILLEPFDKIVVYHRDYFEPDRIVSINGAVTESGQYKLVDNMRIKDLVLIAGGLTDASSTERGELYRRIFEGDTVRTQKSTFCVQCAMEDDAAHNLVLKKMDQVFIRQKKGWEEAKRISLVGEFVYPGEYVVLEGETLGELVKRAGGLTDDAYVSASIFTRESVKKLEEKRIEEYARKLESDMLSVANEISAAGGGTQELAAIYNQQMAMLEQLRKIEPVGRVVVDLADTRNYNDLQLENGDVLYIPKNLKTVSVLGEVFNPATFVLGTSHKTVHDYVQMAGGFKENARKKQTYVIKANGSVRTRRMVNIRRYDLDPGDAVVVPLKLPSSNLKFKMFMDTMQSIISITTNSLLIASTILQIHQSRQ